MSKIDDGGYAFPVLPPAMSDGGCISGYPYPEGGMSLRDWFAGQALPAIITAEGASRFNSSLANAHLAYEFADAMIAARKGDAS